MAYHKTTVEIDIEAFAEAERNLQTRGYKETVNRALLEVNRRAALEHAAAYVRDARYCAPDESTFAAIRAPRA